MEKFEELLDAYRKEKNNKIGTRMLAVKLYYVDKMRIKNIADILTYSEDSISRWIKRYDDGGLDGLRVRPKSGRPPFISYDALKKLILKECEKKLIVPKTLLELVRKQLNVEFSIGHFRKILHKLGMTYKKPIAHHINHASRKEVYNWRHAVKRHMSCLKSQ